MHVGLLRCLGIRNQFMLLIQDAKDSQDLGYITIIKYITPKFSC